MTYGARSVSARRTKHREVDEPNKNDAELSGPRMSEIEDLRSFLRSAYATETATTTVAALLIQSMPPKVRTTFLCPALSLRFTAGSKVSPWDGLMSAEPVRH